VIRFIESFGRSALSVASYLGRLSFLLSRGTAHMLAGRFRRSVALESMVRIGVDSLPLVGVIAFFTGMVMVMEIALTLKKFGGESYVGGIVSLTMVRELGPVFVALIVAGRVGASIAAEVGAMKITEQTDALEVLGVDPVAYLMSPRLFAAIVMMPFLNLIADFLSILGGYAIGVFVVHIGSGAYLHQSFQFVEVRDVFVGLTKAFVFGIVVITASCFEGFRASGGAEGVGSATTKAVVNSFLLVILMNLVLTAVFYFL
jgi:phospholipid/cholesterol/gamma-HCH transport system permease protein